MSSSDPRRRLGDIVDNAARIEKYLAGFDPDSFAKDEMRVDACERCLERIAEAVVKIGDEAIRTIVPDLPVQRVRGLGNLLRHAYDQIDLRSLFNLMVIEVPRLRAAAAAALERRA